MDLVEEIEESVGLSMVTLYDRYGVEVTDPLNGESALLLFGELFSTYDMPREIEEVVSDINYIINEGLLS